MSEMMRIPSGEIWRDENNTPFLILKDQGTFLNSMLLVDGQRPENVQVTERYSTNPGMISFVKKAKLTMKVGFVGGVTVQKLVCEAFERMGMNLPVQMHGMEQSAVLEVTESPGMEMLEKELAVYKRLYEQLLERLLAR